VRNWVNKTSAAPIPSANNPIQTTKDIMISMDKHFPINRGMDSEENRVAMEEFIGRHGNDRPANIDDGNKIAMHHDEDVRMITSIFKSSTSRRLVGQALLGFRLESPTRLSGQVGRLAGDLSFPVD
jgi:hypothetical protein